MCMPCHLKVLSKKSSNLAILCGGFKVEWFMSTAIFEESFFYLPENTWTPHLFVVGILIY